mmetsp:Transcript_7533/g.19085  ORF Transcript_7533/g.19085 Transcript_7533/m.19085 type:complete len:104 (+) Transcript_7533:388-699(+)
MLFALQQSGSHARAAADPHAHVDANIKVWDDEEHHLNDLVSHGEPLGREDATDAAVATIEQQWLPQPARGLVGGRWLRHEILEDAAKCICFRLLRRALECMWT